MEPPPRSPGGERLWTPNRHCLDEAAPSGSSLHYATLFIGPRERAALVAVHALRHTLFGIVDTVADPDVRARKLNWWSDEIMEARDERPRHPVAVAITRHCAAQLWRRPEVLAMLTAIGRASAAGRVRIRGGQRSFLRRRRGRYGAALRRGGRGRHIRYIRPT